MTPQTTHHWKRIVEVDEGLWRADAACLGADPSFFYPEKSGNGWEVREAKKICVGCPVRAECLETALVNRETMGVWGGLTERERRPLRRARRAG